MKQIFYFSLLIISFFALSCNLFKHKTISDLGPVKTYKNWFIDQNQTGEIAPLDSGLCYFFYSDTVLNYEDDDNALYSPIIKIKYTGQWSDYNLRQLDSMFNFCKRFPQCELAFDVTGFGKPPWGGAAEIASYIKKRLKKEHMLHGDTLDCFGHNKYAGAEYGNVSSHCMRIDSAFAEQQRDSAFFIFLTKPKSSTNCCWIP